MYRNLTPAWRIANPPISSGFTLIEVLSAIAILLILVSVSFPLSGAINRRIKFAQARGELAIISQALEQYRAHHGDYPWVDERGTGSGELYAALIGHRRPTGDFVMNSDTVLAASPDPLLRRKGRHFLELESLSLLNEPESSDISAQRSLDSRFRDNALVDPWERKYLYRYKVTGSGRDGKQWKRVGYVLVSSGPDGKLGPAIPGSGIFPGGYREKEGAEDNLYQAD